MARFRKALIQKDRKRIEEILRSTEFFYEFEIQTALEIADETCRRGWKKADITG